MSTATIYTTGHNTQHELEFIVKLHLPKNLADMTNGEMICHIYPEEKTIEWRHDSTIGEYLQKQNRFTRLFWAIYENYHLAIAAADKKDGNIVLTY